MALILLAAEHVVAAARKWWREVHGLSGPGGVQETKPRPQVVPYRESL